jgi:hypothetical protein
MTRAGPGSSKAWKKAAFRYLFAASVALCALGFLALMAFSHQFISAPTTANEATSNIVAWNDHGTYHYITPREDAVEKVLIVFTATTFFGAALFGYLDQKK